MTSLPKPFPPHNNKQISKLGRILPNLAMLSSQHKLFAQTYYSQIGDYQHVGENMCFFLSQF